MTNDGVTVLGEGEGAEMEKALARRETVALEKPADVIAQAIAQATALADLIDKKGLFKVISGRRYVKVEGWVPLARMNGVIPREVENIAHEDGHYVARVQLVRIVDGTVLTEASGECGGPEEGLWQERPPYARRSMAATRATGKACRLAYSWVIALAGYEPTPAEEMDGVTIDATPTRVSTVAVGSGGLALTGTPLPLADEDWTITFGKHEGKSVRDPAVESGYLRWLLDSKFPEDLANPAKKKYWPEIEENSKRVTFELVRRAAMAAELEATKHDEPGY